MNWRPGIRSILLSAGIGVGLVAMLALSGCDDYGQSDEVLSQPTSLGGEAPVPANETSPAASSKDANQAASDDTTVPGATDEEKKAALLRSAIQLIQTAYESPGGTHFDQAIELLAQYFADEPPSAFRMDSDAREYLSSRIPEKGVADLEKPRYTVRDARHIEDSLLYQSIAQRVAGDGDDLTRVERVFDWMTRQVQLIPAGSLGVPPAPNLPNGLPQAQARPFDVLLRGMAVEQGGWAERSWLFMALCRQINVDVGLLRYTPPKQPTIIGLKKKGEESNEPQGPVPWICVALVDGKAYLFDCRIGLPIPGPGGVGVATVEQAVTDPEILARLDLPGVSTYSTTAEDLNAGKLSVWIDSTFGQLTPRMRNLQQQLAGRYRMVLYRNPAEQAAAFRAALGDRLESVDLYPLPMEVEYRLFNDPGFVAATQFPLQIFDARWPLLNARMGQLRGDLEYAVNRYVVLRYAENPLQADGKTPIPAPVQNILDMFATYFLGLAKLDQGQPSIAEDFFHQTLKLLPPPGPDQPYFSMFHWGAETNLGLLHQADGQSRLAMQEFSSDQATAQHHGNLLRARALIWSDPFAPGEPLPKSDILAPGRPTAGAQASVD